MSDAFQVQDEQTPSYFVGVYRGELSRDDGGHMQHYVIEDDTLALFDDKSNCVEYYLIGK